MKESGMFSQYGSWRQVMGWMAVIDSWQRQDFSLLHSVQTSYLAHPTYPMGMGTISLEVKQTIHLHLVPRSRMAELYLHSLVCLHGIVLN
jgi:hypothetical protein